jgi:hypothetical protein
MKYISQTVATLVLCAAALGVSGCGGGGSSSGVPRSNNSAMRNSHESSSPVHHFRFTAFSHDAISGDNILIGGDGRFTEHEASGSGSYTQFHPTSAVPPAVTAAGTYQVTQFVSFTSPGAFGAIEAGVLVVKVNLLQTTPNRAQFPAALTVYCNIGFAGLTVGHLEGVKPQEPEVTFDSVQGLPGITSFSAGPESS